MNAQDGVDTDAALSKVTVGVSMATTAVDKESADSGAATGDVVFGSVPGMMRSSTYSAPSDGGVAQVLRAGAEVHRDDQPEYAVEPEESTPSDGELDRMGSKGSTKLDNIMQDFTRGSHRFSNAHNIPKGVSDRRRTIAWAAS
eukprot:11225965-Heterocapsa_arctica.AAC.1